LATIALPTGAPESAALKRASAGLAGVTLVDKAQSVSDLLAHYRTMAAWALCGAVLLVGILLGAWYGPRSGLRLLAPAVLGMLAALALGALLGVPVTLFTIMALILALGFGVDYTVFLKEGGAPALLGVALASYATLVSYGLLALSHTPALRGFGITLALAVLVSTLTSFLALGGRE
jgi:predicted exporter